MTTTSKARGPLFLGIDTGGTYTDAVLYDESAGIIAKAKALTTRHDLAIGIAGAVDSVLARAACDRRDIRLVSMSTTLATNALVEGQGGRSALVMIGFEPADLAKAGLDKALGSDPVIFCPGGHDVFGHARTLDLSALDSALLTLSGNVTGFAVCAHFAVRNPAHENAARELIRAASGLPVTTSHELSSKLGGPQRALTTLLNARLISMIDRLILATETYLESRAIHAPLMVVRGDGALVSAGFARHRPIETILSGPAASLVGARHLTGLDDAVISDIGGTTTDVAILEKGRPRLDAEGASVGGFRTMVEAIAMRTFGLGGDSEIALEDSGLEPKLRLGPRRLVPLALAGAQHGACIIDTLEKQVLAQIPGRHDGRFAIRTGMPESLAAGLSAPETRLYAAITAAPRPLDEVLSASNQNSTLDRLVARGLVQIIGFTPSDAAHVLGRQENWNGEAARLGAVLFARKRDPRGLPIAESAEALSLRVLAALTRRSAEVILETAFVHDELDGPALVGQPLIQRALEGGTGIARADIGLDRPVIGLGASAGLHYTPLPGLLRQPCHVPADADVANALGAVVGQVRISVTAIVSQPVEGVFRASVGEVQRDFPDEESALAFAEAEAARLALERAREAGAGDAETAIARDIRAAIVEGRHTFIEAEIIATASGRPRIAE